MLQLSLIAIVTSNILASRITYIVSISLRVNHKMPLTLKLILSTHMPEILGKGSATSKYSALEVKGRYTSGKGIPLGQVCFFFFFFFFLPHFQITTLSNCDYSNLLWDEELKIVTFCL